MTSVAVDIAPVRDWFAELSAIHSAVDRDVSESFAALEAYQAHLDRWQEELAAEREALDDERAAVDAERQRLAELPTGAQEQLAELIDAKKLISELRDMLLERTDELRRSDSKRAELVSELQLARTRHLDLEKTLEAEKSQHIEQQLRWTEEFHRVSEVLGGHIREDVKCQPEATSNPVLGSIMAQFGKLQRQAAGRRAVRAAL